MGLSLRPVNIILSGQRQFTRHRDKHMIFSNFIFLSFSFGAFHVRVDDSASKKRARILQVSKQKSDAVAN